MASPHGHDARCVLAAPSMVYKRVGLDTALAEALRRQGSVLPRDVLASITVNGLSKRTDELLWQ